MKRKGSIDTEAQAFAGAPSSSPVLTPEDVQSKEFRVSRLGGYRMRDVDEFLDHVTDSISALMAENARLRGQREGGEAGAPGADLEDAEREAERILRDARDEAARIVADAPGGGAGDGDSQATSPDPAAVQTFLRREREFLRALGSLVQGHAEEMKGMAREARRHAEVTATEEGVVAPPPAPQPADPGATAAMTREELGVDDEEPVRVSEPEPAASTRTEKRNPDGSLRELFWGEDA